MCGIERVRGRREGSQRVRSQLTFVIHESNLTVWSTSHTSMLSDARMHRSCKGGDWYLEKTIPWFCLLPYFPVGQTTCFPFISSYYCYFCPVGEKQLQTGQQYSTTPQINQWINQFLTYRNAWVDGDNPWHSSRHCQFSPHSTRDHRLAAQLNQFRLSFNPFMQLPSTYLTLSQSTQFQNAILLRISWPLATN